MRDLISGSITSCISKLNSDSGRGLRKFILNLIGIKVRSYLSKLHVSVVVCGGSDCAVIEGHVLKMTNIHHHKHQMFCMSSIVVFLILCAARIKSRNNNVY